MATDLTAAALNPKYSTLCGVVLSSRSLSPASVSAHQHRLHVMASLKSALSLASYTLLSDTFELMQALHVCWFFILRLLLQIFHIYIYVSLLFICAH